MKNIIRILFIAVLMSNTACAQKLSADKIPAAVMSTFKAKFPTATKTSWSMENAKEYEAEFKLNGEEVSANFDLNGSWLETEYELKVADLPAVIQAALTKDFVGFKTNEASKLETLKDGKCFEVEIQKGDEAFDILFAPNGKVLSRTKIEKEKGDKD